jgi:hypothetical protein
MSKVVAGRELFHVTLQPGPGVGLPALRLALKALLRQYGLRCIAVRISLGSDAPQLEQSREGDVARVNTHTQEDGQ